MRPVLVIPARLAATRLPGKPLAMIGDAPMIVHVWRRAIEAGIGPVLVACDRPAIADVIEAAGGRAVLTDPDLASGGDRVRAALDAVDSGRVHDVVVNVQGDLPTISPAAIRAALLPLADPAVDIATIAAEIRRDEERDDPNVVKVVGTAVAPGRLRALYFTRAIAPHGPGPLFHHIGLYAFRRAALDRFFGLPPSELERRERLEQLRALEAGMRIDVQLVDEVPLGVDSPADLERARAHFARTGKST
ncbi:MAG: 3-deoxy-manno-octulosonate cytidylyltransferase [Hyphomicrobiales bacterium]|nr:3-deoxy-manno-octulosonate cytidylyltransferase [Hyphomicrobiales bacterium]MDE2017600.1 3-deoxy-manno-octulosonate cytidylyltransferase [Hyphomicrobiales bacterium]